MCEYPGYLDDLDYEHHYDYGSKNRGVSPGIHVMNKDEARVMRRLQSQTGLSQEEIRKHKKYRKMLSEAQKAGQNRKRTEIEKIRDKVLKYVCKKLQLPKEHPDIIVAFKEEWLKRRENWIYSKPNIFESDPPPIK
jgi:hypothetical protein